MNVLLTCAGRRYNLAGYFRDALAGDGLLIGADMDLTAPALAACDRVHKVPPLNAPDYLNCIIEIISRDNVQMVFSLSDLEVGLLAQNREVIEAKTGASIFVPDPPTLRICADKLETYHFSKHLDLPTIPTFLSPERALRAVREGATRFPMIVKPRWGSASIALEIVEDEASLRDQFEACGKAISQSTLSQFGTENAVIIQQLIVGVEYGVDVLFSAACEFQGFTAKRKLGMRSGETDKAVTAAPGRFQNHIHKIAKSLRHRGNLDCDFLEQNGELYLLEMNPRFGGGYPFTHGAGANHVQRLIDIVSGKSVADYGYKTGLCFAKADILIQVPTPTLE